MSIATGLLLNFVNSSCEKSICSSGFLGYQIVVSYPKITTVFLDFYTFENLISFRIVQFSRYNHRS